VLTVKIQKITATIGPAFTTVPIQQRGKGANAEQLQTIGIVIQFNF
jgi:hypothetical protein